MSYIYLQEQGEASLGENFSDIEQYVQSKLKNIQERFCSNDSETESCHGFPSGMTLQHLTANHGKGELILLPGGSHVKTFLQQEKALASRESGQDSGERWPGWLAKYDLNSCLWKTPQCSLLGDLEEFSGTWPKWGIMHDGACWGLMTPERRTEGKEFGYWATPLCMDSLPPKSDQALMHEATITRPGRQKPANLRDQVNPESIKRWPTPMSRDYKGPMYEKPNTKPRKDYLPNAVKLHSFPTPGTTGFSSGTGNCEKANQLYRDNILTEAERISFRAGNGGQLNPDWTEWLMGWPIGYTRLEPIEIDWRGWTVDPADTGEVPRVGRNIKKRTGRLKAIGNGQVPLTAAMAFTILSEGII